MISSRSIDDLSPPVKERVKRFLEECGHQGIDLLVTSTYRDDESQDLLYAQGRTAAGRIITQAKGGDSFHNYRCALDVVPLVNGKPDWDGTHDIWERVGAIGKANGLDWAGDWKSFRELAHFQYTGGLTLSDLKQGKGIK